MDLGPMKLLQPNATTWVMKNPEGLLVAIRVIDMTDQHLWRWLQYFRRKFREERGFVGTETQLDAAIQAAIVTAPAIYAEATKRHLLPGIPVTDTSKSATIKKAVVEPTLGSRRINLDED
jgi:hypothetical protein